MILKASLRTGFPQWSPGFESGNTWGFCFGIDLFTKRDFFSPQFFWWQQIDWRYKLLVSSSQDLSGLRKKFNICWSHKLQWFLCKFKRVQVKLQKAVDWISASLSQRTLLATYTHSPFSQKNVLKVLYKPLSTEALDWLKGF